MGNSPKYADANDFGLAEWERFLEQVFKDTDLPPRMFIWKGDLYTPQPDGSYDPPLPATFMELMRKIVHGKVQK